MPRRSEQLLRTNAGPGRWLAASLIVLLSFAHTNCPVQTLARANARGPSLDETLQISASFSDAQPVTPDRAIVLQLSREVKSSEGRFAMLIGQTDVTALFTVDKTTMTYNAALLPLPLGDWQLTVYLISRTEEWKEVARFNLQVKEQGSGVRRQETTGKEEKSPAQASELVVNSSEATEKDVTGKDATEKSSAEKSDKPADAASANTASNATQDAAASGAQSATSGRKAGFDKLDFIPSLTIGFKSQAAERHFPDSLKPPRPTFSDLIMQGTMRGEISRGLFTAQNQFDVAGSSFAQEALRFGQLGNEAPQVDLASYLMQFQVSKAKILVGHTAYGANRLLVNNFTSRGVTVTVPLSPNFDVSLAAMNGTNIVGIDNFFGLGRRNHQLLSGTLGAELIKERPGGARLEVSYVNGYIQALSSFTQGNVNDVERSRGLGVRFLTSDPKQRFRFDGGFARSAFFNPADPLLEQGREVVAIPEIVRNARYIDTGFDILKDLTVSESRKATLTLNFRHETVDPLYRSLGVSTQADKTQNQIELIGALGDINAQFSHLWFHDNLRDIPSILKSQSRAERLALGVPLGTLLGDPAKPSSLLPRLSYTLDRIHQFGASIPVNGGFEFAPEAIPNLLGTNQVFTSDWQLEKMRIGYRFNHSMQNNQQPGRELADLINQVHTVSTGFTVAKPLDLTVDFSSEQVKNRENQRLDRTFRIATVINWRVTGRNLIATNFANTFLGDAAKTSRNYNLELDLQWSYQFTLGKEKFKKLQGQTFIRYANRYTDARDFVFGQNNRTRIQTLNIGLSFTFF